jgi:hypothetical protein
MIHHDETSTDIPQTPPRQRKPMPEQDIAVWTPGDVLKSVASLLQRSFEFRASYRVD